MSQLSKEFSIYDISSQLVSQIPWRTLSTVIIPKSHSHEEMLWYINQTYKNRWSRSQVELQFKAKAYKRYLINQDTSIQDSEVSINTELNEIVKDTYVLDFIVLSDVKTEKNYKIVYYLILKNLF